MADSTSNSPIMNGNKLSGQLIIKAQLDDDIRKMMIHNEDLTLNELVLMMERVFAGKISNSDELTIKYLDDDGDKITLLNDSDLTVALHFHKILRLFVFVNGNEQINTNSTDNINKNQDLIDAKAFQTELQHIRNSVQTILDRLQLSISEAPTESTSTVPSTETTREFDPIKHSQVQQPAVPDSTQSNSNSTLNNGSTVEAQRTETTDVNKTPSSTFNNEQQARTNIFGPPPTTTTAAPAYPPMPSLPNNTVPRFPPATTPTPPPSSLGQSAAFIGQQAPPPSGFYSQQQNLYQPRPPQTSFNPNNTFAPQQSSTPATINPSFVQPPPPMVSQQHYGAYPPQNTYYNPIQQYPKTS